MDLKPAEQAFVRQDIDGLCAELGRLYPDQAQSPALAELGRFALGWTETMPRPGGADGVFVASIAAARNFWLDGKLEARRHHRVARQVIGTDLDFLGERVGPESWGVARALNRLVLDRINPTRRAAVIGTMRDDGIYALEWIAHYLALGFDGIFIYTNDNADGSELLLRCLADHGVITLVESETLGQVRPEVKAFEHATDLVHTLRDYEWVLFVDSDEFLQLAPQYGHSVGQLMEAIAAMPSASRPSAVVYEWLWFNSGMVFERQPGPLMERFQYASPHWLNKTFVRLRDLISMRMQHVPHLRLGCIAANSALAPFDLSLAFERRSPVYEGGRINHYWPKSFEEFSLKKARGDSLHLSEVGFHDEYHRSFRRFFEWNAAETPDTHYPPDANFLAAVKRTRQRLRALRGVAELEDRINARFAALLGRYDAEGGLREIYTHLSREKIVSSLPVD